MSGKEREAETCCGTANSVGSQSRSCVHQVDVDEVVEDAQEAKQDTEADQATCHHGRPEADRRVGSPTEPEECDGQARTSEHDGVKSLLGWDPVDSLGLEFIGCPGVSRVEIGDVECYGGTSSEEEGNEHDTRYASVETMTK